ncbi:basic proline-rich protein-like [Meles meles]|uniref:basic proline-rich protein-like n=1 Tax=Meles meles TaxID=9662 RepID=UPI001E69F3C0|nr:basic proline-rich protein-like [Meles meles]
MEATYLPVPPPPPAPGGRLPATWTRPPSPTPAPLARPRRRSPCAPPPRPHTGQARGRRGLLNPDRTTAQAGDVQGEPGGRERGREPLLPPGPRGALRATRDPRNRPGPCTESGSPFAPHNGRVRGTRLSPSSPPAASGNPGTCARPRHTPSGPARRRSAQTPPRLGAPRRVPGHLLQVRGRPRVHLSGAHRRRTARSLLGTPSPPRAIPRRARLTAAAVVAAVLGLPWLVGATPAAAAQQPPPSARATAASYKDTIRLGLGSILLQHDSS